MKLMRNDVSLEITAFQTTCAVDTTSSNLVARSVAPGYQIASLQDFVGNFENLNSFPKVLKLSRSCWRLLLLQY
jgi:hypothetical protein